MTIYYTYAYLRTDGTPYYIGKGKGRRAWSKQRKGCKPPSDLSRILILKENLSEEEAFKHEMYLIFVFGRKDLGTGILRNLTDGGEGSSGSVRSEDFKKSRSGKNHPFHGKPRSEEVRQRLREVNLGKVLSQETKEKISAGHKGRRFSEEHKQKLAEVKIGKPRSVETREKLKNSMTGKNTGDTNPNSKRVEVTYPDGSVVIFPYVKAAAEALDCSKDFIKSRMSRETPPRWGKLIDHSFRYLTRG